MFLRKDKSKEFRVIGYCLLRSALKSMFNDTFTINKKRPTQSSKPGIQTKYGKYFLFYRTLCFGIISNRLCKIHIKIVPKPNHWLMAISKNSNFCQIPQCRLIHHKIKDLLQKQIPRNVPPTIINPGSASINQ